MASAGHKRRRARLRGWLRYAPFILVPFAIFAFETWSHYTLIQNDYEMSGIRRELREVSARMEELNDDVARLERLERMQSKAPDLGLVAPTPTQVRVVHLPQRGPASLASRGIELAQVDIIADELLLVAPHIE